MRQITLLLLGICFTGAQAYAGGLEAKTMRDPFSNRSNERGLVLGKGWFQVGLGSSYKLASGYWDSEGIKQDFESTDWTYTTQHLDLRYGITRNAELYWKFKTHYVSLKNTDLETDITQFGIGDPEFGYKFQLFRTNAPLTSVIVYGDYKAPLANETPGNYVGGPNTFSSVILTTGTADVTTGMAAKKQLGPLAVTLDYAHVFRTSGLAQYAIETDLNQFQTRVKPGDIDKIDAEASLQLGPVALSGGALFQQRKAFQIGPTSAGVFPNKNLKKIEGSDGWSLDAKAGLILNVFTELDIAANALIPIKGQDLLFFPLEDVHPTYGYTYSGEVIFRF
jgi:hypothetical protein